MPYTAKATVLLSFIFISGHFAFGQSIENVTAEVSDGNKVVISYDLKGNADTERFQIQVYSSHNGFSSPLSSVTGDVSSNFDIKPGNGKQVTWDAAKDLKTFNGELSFEVRAKVYAFIRISSPGSVKSVRRGSNTTINWAGGMPNDNIKIELLKAGSVISNVGSTSNSGSYRWAVPSDLEKGSDYSLRFTTSSDQVYSESFNVNAKYPMALKAGAPALAVGAIVLLSGGGGDDGPLPTPPEPN